MPSPDLRALTERLARGESVALPSPLPRELPLPPGVLALRVRCGADQRILGPWRDLSSRAAQLLHEPDPERHDLDTQATLLGC